MVVGQSRNRRHLIGTSISKSFLVFYRLILFRFFFCWIATAKPIQAVTFVLFVPLFRPVAAGSLRQSCPAFSHRSRLLFRFFAAGSPRQSYSAYLSRSYLSFVLLQLDRYRKAVQPSHIVRVYLFVWLMLDRYGRAVQLTIIVPRLIFVSSFFCWIATAKLSSLNFRSLITN